MKNGSSAVRRLSSAVSGHLSAVGARLSSALRLFIRHSSFVIRHSAVIRHFSISVLLLLALALGVRALARDPAPSAALSKDHATRDAAVARAAGWPPSADPLPADFSLTPPLPVAAAGDGDAAAGEATPAPPPPTDPPTPIAGELPAVIVGERGANLRRGPGPQYDVVATLRAGVVLPAHGVNPSGEWIQVRLPGKGWPWIDIRYAALPQGLELPVITQFAWAVTVVPVSSVAAPPSPTPVPTTGAVTTGPTPPPHHGPLPTPLTSPTPPRPTLPPNYWPTPTSPPP